MWLISCHPKRIHRSLGGMQCLIPEGTPLRYRSVCLKGKRWALMAPSKGHHFATPIVLLMHSTQHVSYCLSGKLWLSLWNVVLQVFLRVILRVIKSGVSTASGPSVLEHRCLPQGLADYWFWPDLIVPNRSEACPGGGKESLDQAKFLFFNLPLGCRG